MECEERSLPDCSALIAPDKVEKPVREGTILQLAGWEDNFCRKLLKPSLYDGSNTQVLVLRQSEYSDALKVFAITTVIENRTAVTA
ncbi:hypothetical protein KH389_27095 [Pseudomonas qingdaonensis]|uniref:Uncharacterized protein n=1 Tax=Pseudomonas qingdaonensis TaxID=2056231 RepID=A0ABX8DRX0_9PSED|nr:hypothetical protein [Pseudomonas qingdaonensis]QVL18978.1 hypothetical protein KH389_27095 [Pseudomonas qingdaonensis]